MSISPTEAARAAERGLREISEPEVAAAYTASHPGVALLVKRLDQIDDDYYLVPWQDSRGVVLVVQVDASTGKMLSAAALPIPLPSLVMSPAEARHLAKTHLNRRVTGEPALVWRPSRESASPLQPFYYVPTEGGDAYITVNGSVYQRLTPFGMGGQG